VIKNILRTIANIFASFFTDQDQTLGDLIFSAPPPWKLSCLTNTSKGLFIGVYNSETRRNSKLYLDGNLIYEGSEETIGQGVEYDGSVYFAGENGRILIYTNGKITKGAELQFASTCVVFGGKPYVLNTKDNKIGAINCLTNVEEFQIPGSGIVTMALVRRGKLYAVACDGAGGLTCLDGTFIGMADCQCLIEFAGMLLVTRRNKIYEVMDGDNLELVDELPCEKIMHAHVSDGLLWVTGSNPDTLWSYNPMMRRKDVACFPADKTPVGGSVFRTRVTQGYWGRAKNGIAAAVYKIK
jgi:hypothetical protein